MLSKIPYPLDASMLLAKDQVLAQLKENGCSDRALVTVRATYMAAFGDEMMWLFPICFGGHLGARIIAVKEGFLYLPYDSMDPASYEIFLPEEARLTNAEELDNMRNLLTEYAEDIHQAFGQAMHLLQGNRLSARAEK